MAKKNKLVLVDGHAIVHRAFHALPNLTSRKGEMVGAVYGFSLILLNMFKDLKPTHAAVTFDLKEPTFRHKKYKEYKAKRVKAPEELHAQTDKIKKIVRALNIPVFEKAGFEADDVIATLAEQTSKITGLETIIATGDLDALQLVDKKTRVYSMRRGITDTVIYDEDMVKERYGLKPSQMNDFKGLRGDPSDNIPGVPGIGEKTAAHLIRKYGTLENVLEKAKKGTIDISERFQNLLKEHASEARLSKKLVILKKNVPIKLDLQKCELHDFEREKVVEIFVDLGFKSLLAKIPKPKNFIETKQTELFQAMNTKKKVGRKDLKYHLIQNNDEIEVLLKELASRKEIVIDVETDRIDGKIIGISFSFKEKEAYYVPWSNLKSEILSPPQREPAEAGNLKSVLENQNIKKIGHNIKYDLKILKKEGIKLAPIYFDTMIAAYLLEPGSRSYDLDRLAFVELGIEMIPIESLIGLGREQKLLSEIPVEKVAHYSSEDSDITFRLYKKLGRELQKKKLEKLFSQIEMPLVPILAEMEENGIKINKNHFKKLSRKIGQRILSLKKKVFEFAGKEFNINSTQQLRQVLFEKLKIKTIDIRRTKTGFSTAAPELEKMRDRHEIIDLIFEYRELAKLKNTYLDALPKMAKDGNRIHTSFNQTITATGRLSSSNPNLQNIPIRTEVGNKIRKGFVASSGKSLLSVDYSQIELRIAAHIANDKKMIKAFKEGKDIHTSTAAEIFDLSDNNVTKRMRRVAKVVNFGVLYGLSGFGMSERIQISRDEANKFIEKYFEEYPEIKGYTEKTIKEAKKKGSVETLFKRRRLLPEINSGVFQIRAGAERMAINMPIQGTAADIIKIAMIEIEKKILNKSKDCKLLLQVHDELLFEMPRGKIKTYKGMIQKIMEGVVKLKVPVKVDLSEGRSWGNLRNV